MSIDPTLAAIADEDLDYLLPQLVEKQPEVLEAEGFYLQMLGQPSPLPESGQTGTPDPAETRPSDRATSAEDWGITYRAATPVKTSVWEVRAHCVMMGGAKICVEDGWSIVQEVISGGARWSRQIVVEGPGDSREWSEEVAPPFPAG